MEMFVTNEAMMSVAVVLHHAQSLELHRSVEGSTSGVTYAVYLTKHS